jgi:hypothetical protein
MVVVILGLGVLSLVSSLKSGVEGRKKRTSADIMDNRK